MATIDFEGITARIMLDFKKGNITAANAEIATIRLHRAEWYADEFIRMVSKRFREAYMIQNPGYRYPFDGILEKSEPEQVHSTNIDGVDYIVLGITLGRDNYRPSIKRKDGQDNGIDNILSLFETGYSARHTVYGIWHSYSYGADIDTHSRRVREGLNAVHETIDEFNNKYWKEGVQVWFSPETGMWGA